MTNDLIFNVTFEYYAMMSWGGFSDVYGVQRASPPFYAEVNLYHPFPPETHPDTHKSPFVTITMVYIFVKVLVSRG